MSENRVCCVCGHTLDAHIEEGEWWRCHCLDGSLFQCECRLWKVVAEGDGIDYFDLEKRAEEQVKDLENIGK